MIYFQSIWTRKYNHTAIWSTAHFQYMCTVYKYTRVNAPMCSICEERLCAWYWTLWMCKYALMLEKCLHLLNLLVWINMEIIIEIANWPNSMVIWIAKCLDFCQKESNWILLIKMIGHAQHMYQYQCCFFHRSLQCISNQMLCTSDARAHNAKSAVHSHKLWAHHCLQFGWIYSNETVRIIPNVFQRQTD